MENSLANLSKLQLTKMLIMCDSGQQTRATSQLRRAIKRISDSDREMATISISKMMNKQAVTKGDLSVDLLLFLVHI